MNSGLYAACTGLMEKSQALELAANNLANLNTNGFKAQLPSFQSVLASAATTRISSKVGDAVNQFGVIGGRRTDLQQGSLERTGGDLDFAIRGEGWFEIRSAAGVAYTRNGNFHVDSRGRLLTSGGDSVVGTQGPIRIPPGKLTVSNNGAISVDGALAGQLRVVSFPPTTPLTPIGAAQYTAPAGASRPAQGANIVQGSLESSNVNGISAAVGLVTLQRSAEMLQRALTTFHADFNRIAAQDLARI
jgi:flagellar basal-body rod protein FlgF/flagellar basal-body rod protein FlgG